MCFAIFLQTQIEWVSTVQIGITLHRACHTKTNVLNIQKVKIESKLNICALCSTLSAFMLMVWQQEGHKNCKKKTEW